MIRVRRRAAGLALALALGVALAATVASRAHAQLGVDVPRTLGQQPPENNGLAVAQKLPFWGAGATRWFLAATFDVGVITARETLVYGYGKPHWEWAGVEGYVALATQGASEYVGLHVALPYVELRGGARYSFDFGQYFLPPEETYFRNDLLRQLGPQQRYVAYEAEASWTVPLPRSALFGIATVGYITDVPKPYFVFEDTLHAVFEPPWYTRFRLGYFYRFGLDGNLKLGGAAEFIFDPDRGLTTLRTGPVFAITLSHHLDASASFMVVAASEDEIGLLGGEFTSIGFRYRWATGDRWPEFP